ncbi:AraC family transcriptional regulator ligand-binding domain-containing protein [Litorivivens sp.]|uniref:AraC family transcriptional regulator n=1 Tax=Litorivivens sp. TaxID=2020868 RepID=UPI0035671ABD
MSNYVRASILKNFGEFIQQYGGNENDLLESAGIDINVAGKSDKYISYSNFIRLLQHVEDKLGISRAGLHLGLMQNYRVLGPVAFLAIASEDVREAIYNTKSYFSQFTSVIALDINNQSPPELFFEISAAGCVDAVQAAEHTIAATVRVLETVSGGACVPSCVQFSHERPEDGTDYESLLGCEVRFSQDQVAVAIDEGHLDIPIRTADSELKYLVSSYLTMQGIKQLKNNPQQTAFITKVFQIVNELLPTGRATRSLVASALNMHERSLHRRLTDYGQTFEAIVETIRRDKVQVMMAQPDLTMLEISQALGYHDQSSFNRAFKRWFGITPSQYASRARGSR